MKAKLIRFYFQNLQECSERKSNMCKVLRIVNQNYDIYKTYDVKVYLDTHILVVNPKYRGRKIGQYLLATNQLICAEFGIRLASATFSSNFSNRIADKVGYKIDKAFKYPSNCVL